MIVFVASKAGTSFDHELELALDVLRGQSGIEVTVKRHDARFGPRVQDAIEQQIASADVVIADLRSGLSYGAFEAGLAMGIGKPVVLLAIDSNQVPGALQSSRVILAPEQVPTSYLVSNIAHALTLAVDRSTKRVDMSRTLEPAHVFISYSHSDSEYLARILVHLQPLQREGLIDAWSDTRLTAGDDWRAEIKARIKQAAAAILLISADFLASDFIAADELPPLLRAAEDRGARIIPVIVKPSRFLRDDKLNRFHAINDPREPLLSMSEAEREQLYARLAETVESALDSRSSSLAQGAGA